jgi:hypothetical protein
VGADKVNCWATSRQRARVSRDDQCQRYFIIYLHKFCYMDSISYNLYNFVIQILYLSTCIILQDSSGSAEDQPHSGEPSRPSGSGRTPLDTRHSSLRTRLRCHEGGRLGKATTSLLLQSLQIQSLNGLLNQSVRGNHFIYSQSIMAILANTNCCTHLSCSSWEDTMFWGTGHQRKVNAVLGNLVRMHYPSEVTWSNGTTSLATC